MKKIISIFVLFLFISFNGFTHTAQGQSAKLFFGDLLNGTVNGVALGAATMALQNSNNVAPLRVGTGFGVLYGAGIGLYDNSIVPKGQEFYISGAFNDGRNSSIIVLLDTFYGAAAGATIGGAISLIANDPILKGLQYGSGAGAWIGFGFGLIDSFSLAQGPNDLSAYLPSHAKDRAPGIVQIADITENMSVGLLNPSLFSRINLQSHQFERSSHMGVEVLNVHMGF